MTSGTSNANIKTKHSEFPMEPIVLPTDLKVYSELLNINFMQKGLPTRATFTFSITFILALAFS